MVRIGSPVIQRALNLSAAFGIVLIGGGVWLVYLGATGDTNINLFGNSFSSTNVGVVGIFCGAVLVGLIFRRALKSLEHLADVDRATGGREK